MMTVWSEFKKTIKYPKLGKDISVDVAIIGGGITGILCAYTLSKQGKKVVLVEESELLSGATSMTTAFITKVIDTELSELISIWGEERALQVFQSGQEAIEEFEKLINIEGIDCEFMRCDNYIFTSTAKQAEDLKKEAVTYQELQIPAYIGKAGDLAFPNNGQIRVPRQAKFHVAKFCYALAEKAVKNGALIFEHTRVKKIHEGEEAVELQTPQGKITAKDAIVATYQPLTNEKTRLKKGMYMSYVFEVQIPANLFPEAIYEDFSNPYYYFRIDRGDKHDRMIVGGEDHRRVLGKSKTLQEKSFQGLEEYLAKIMQEHPYRIVKKWTGPILEPSDGLPLIGKINAHLYVASAFSGNGMTYSMISSLLLKDLIIEKKNSWSQIYDPQRTLLHPKRIATKARDYTEEFFHGAVKNLLSKRD